MVTKDHVTRLVPLILSTKALAAPVLEDTSPYKEMAVEYYKVVSNVEDPQQRFIGYRERVLKDYHHWHYKPSVPSSTVYKLSDA